MMFKHEALQALPVILFFALSSADLHAAIEPRDEATVLNFPRHRGSRLPIATESHPDGVCRYFGFEKAVPGTFRAGASYEVAVVLGSSGRALEGRPGVAIFRLKCRGQSGQQISESSDHITYPKYGSEEAYLADDSPGSAICKHRGYNGYLKGSIRSGAGYVATIQLNDRGEVVNRLPDNVIKTIVCLN